MSKAMLMPTMISLAVFMGVTLVALIIRRVCFTVMPRWARWTRTTMDDLPVVSLRWIR